MTDFDPNEPLVTQADHDRYVSWCAGRLMAFVEEVEEVGEDEKGSPKAPGYAMTMLAATWLWVVAQAQIHLDENIIEHRERHQENLGGLFLRARKVERATLGDMGLKELLACRVALDCFNPSGKHADALLTAARMAIEALELIFIYPPADKWEIKCAGPWVLVHMGAIMLSEINDEPEPLTYGDYSVVPSAAMEGNIAWNTAARTAQSVGAAPPSPN